VITFVDITQRERVEEALRDAGQTGLILLAIEDVGGRDAVVTTQEVQYGY